MGLSIPFSLSTSIPPCNPLPLLLNGNDCLDAANINDTLLMIEDDSDVDIDDFLGFLDFCDLPPPEIGYKQTLESQKNGTYIDNTMDVNDFNLV